MTNPLHLSAAEGLPFIDIVREFNAPVEAVFRAHADPELYARWLGPAGYEMALEQHEFRTGGRYRFVHTDPDGNDWAFNGIFHVVRENELVIQTFEFEGVPDVVSIESLRFVPLEGGRARLQIHSVHPSVEARDAMVASGMQDGVHQGYQKLDAVLERIR